MGHQTFASLLARRSLSILFASYRLAHADYSRNFFKPEGVCEKSWRPSALWFLVSKHASVSHGLTCVKARMPPWLEALPRLRSASVHDVSHIGRLRENVDSIAKKKPSDLASTHSPCARLSIHRLSTNVTMMFDLSCCVTRMRYLQVLRSLKRLKMFRVLYYSFSSIGRSSRHSDGVVLRTFLFLEATSALHAARNARVRVWEPHVLLDNLGLVFALDKGPSSHHFTSNSILRKFFKLQVLHGYRFYFRWITIRMKQQPDLVYFRHLSICLTIRPRHKLHLSSWEHKHLMTRATSRTHSSAGFRLPCVCLSTLKRSRRSVSPPARASSRRRRLSICPVTRVVLPPAGCLVPRRSVGKTTRAPPVRSSLQSKLSGEKTILRRPRDADHRDAVFPIPQRFGRGGSDSDSEESDRHAMGKKLCERARLRAMVDLSLSGTSGGITPIARRSSATSCSTSVSGRVISFMTFCSESTLPLKTPASRQCSGDLLQSTPHGRVASSRRHKTGWSIGS